MKITSLDEVEKTRLQMEGAVDVWKQIPISKDDGSPTFSVRVFTIGQNGCTPFHAHPFEHLNYVIEGRGVLVTEGKEEEIEKGHFALVLPDEKHRYKNTGEKPLILICAVPKEHE